MVERGAEVVQKLCRGSEVVRCRGGAVVVVQRCRCRGGEVLEVLRCREVMQR